MHEVEKNIIRTGTTTLGIMCKDGIVLAADKRVTEGERLIAHKMFDKVFLITDKIAVTTAGNVSEVQLLLKLTKAELKLRQLRTKTEPGVRETASLFAMLTYENIRKFSPLIAISAFLVAGVDKKGFWLFEIAPDGSLLEHKDYVSTGSGSIIVYGLLEDAYKQDISVEEGIKLAIRAISAAMHRDTPSGSGIDVVTITKEGAKKVMTQEVKEIFVKK